MENQFEILREKFEKHIGVNNSSMELCELDDTNIVFEVVSKEVNSTQLTYIDVFMSNEFRSFAINTIECIDNRQFLTYRFLK